MQLASLTSVFVALGLASSSAAAQDFSGMIADLQAGKIEPHVRVAVEQPGAFGLARALFESLAKYCPDVATPLQAQDVELSADANYRYYTFLKYAQHQPNFGRKEKKDLIEFGRSRSLAKNYEITWKTNVFAADTFVRKLIESGNCEDPKLAAIAGDLFGLLTFGPIPSRDRIHQTTLAETPRRTRDEFFCVYRSSSGDRISEIQRYYHLSSQMIRSVLSLPHQYQTNYMYWRLGCPSHPDPWMPVERHIASNKAAATDPAEMAKEMAVAFLEQILPDREPQIRLSSKERSQISLDITLFETPEVSSVKIDEVATVLRDKRVEELRAKSRGRPLIYTPGIGEFRIRAENSLRQELFQAAHGRAFDAADGRSPAVLICIESYLKTRQLVKSRAYFNVHGRFPH